MPLTGDAKREYQKLYMRQARQVVSAAKKKVKKLSGCALVSTAAKTVSQNMVSEALDRQGYTLDRHLEKRIALTEHEKTLVVGNGETIKVADGDVQCRAMDAMDKILERGGLMPAIADHQQAPGLTLIELHYHASEVLTNENHKAESQAIDVSADNYKVELNGLPADNGHYVNYRPRRDLVK